MTTAAAMRSGIKLTSELFQPANEH